MKTPNFMGIFLILIPIFFENSFIYGQNLNFQKHYATNNATDDANDVHVGGDSRVYVCGGTLGFGDGLISCYTSTGSIPSGWPVTYNGGSSDVFNAVATYTSGSTTNIYATGIIDVGGTAGYNMLLVKYNSSGVFQWARNRDNSTTDVANCIAIDASENIYIAGRSISNGNDFFIVKYNSAGVFQWENTWNNSGAADEVQFIKLNSAGTYLYIAGISNVTSTNHNAVLIRVKTTNGSYLTSDGGFVSIWDNTIADDIDEVYSMDIDANEYIYLAGTTQTSTSANSQDALILKYNNSGSLLGSNTYNSTYNLNDYFGSVDVAGPAASTEVYAAGYNTKTITSPLDEDYLLVRYNISLAQQWVTFYNGSGILCPSYQDRAYMVMKSPNTGKIYVTGNSYETVNNVNQGMNMTTVQFRASDGLQQWSHTYNRQMTYAPYVDQVELKYPMDIQYDACHSSDFIYVIGKTMESGTPNWYYDATTLQYGFSGACDGPEGDGRIMANSENTSILAEIYPNPSAGISKFRYGSSETIVPNASFIIYDVRGIIIKRMDNLESNEFDIDMTGFAEGLYIYTYVIDDRILATGKLVLQH